MSLGTHLFLDLRDEVFLCVLTGDNSRAAVSS